MISTIVQLVAGVLNISMMILNVRWARTCAKNGREAEMHRQRAEDALGKIQRMRAGRAGWN